MKLATNSDSTYLDLPFLGNSEIARKRQPKGGGWFLACCLLKVAKSRSRRLLRSLGLEALFEEHNKLRLIRTHAAYLLVFYQRHTSKWRDTWYSILQRVWRDRDVTESESKQWLNSSDTKQRGSFSTARRGQVETQ